MQRHQSEYKTITAIAGGEITLDSPLAFYHYGQGASSADEYNGVDIRGEVQLLSRNIKILGEDIDGWGGQVMVTDMFESDGTWRKGSLIMDNVQVYNCSQKDSYHSAVRFEGASGGYSRVSNSAVHNGLDWAVLILSSNNIELIGNTFVGFRAVGMNIDYARNCTIDGNFIGDIVPRNIAFIDSTIDKEACVAYGSYEKVGGTPTYDMTFTNNIAAGCKFAGFIAPGHDCGDSNDRSFYGNVAHSVEGYGWYGYPNPAKSTSKCVELSNFSGYKNIDPCVQTFLNSDRQ